MPNNESRAPRMQESLRKFMIFKEFNLHIHNSGNLIRKLKLRLCLWKLKHWIIFPV
jgi:hypothetical protein